MEFEHTTPNLCFKTVDFLDGTTTEIVTAIIYPQIT
jgi:hypothetical protein